MSNQIHSERGLSLSQFSADAVYKIPTLQRATKGEMQYKISWTQEYSTRGYFGICVHARATTG